MNDTELCWKVSELYNTDEYTFRWWVLFLSIIGGI
jgi:hypothetical protein